MEEGKKIILFIPDIAERDIQRERAIARQLRESSWWKRKCSKGKCYYCNEKVPPKELTMDHIVPLVRGGKSVKINIVAACKECNSRKKYNLPLEWDDYMKSMDHS
ncbi:MAG: HNH endonuclease [Dissulfurispiraceae bacterium]